LTVLLFSIGLFLLLMACLKVLRFTESGFLRPVFPLFLLLKIIGGIAVGVIFFHFYGFGDTITYFNESQHLYERVYGGQQGIFELFLNTENLPFEGQPRAQFMLKIVTLFSFFSMGNYYVIAFYISVLTALAAWKLADTLCQIYNSKVAAIVAILFLPTSLFWGSGIVKESIALAAIFSLVNHLIRLVKLNEQKLTNYYWIIFASVVLLNLKYYYAAIILPLVVVLIIVYQIDRRYEIRRRFLVPTMLLMLVLGVGGATMLHPNLNFKVMPEVIYGNHEAFKSMSREDNIIKYENIEPSWKSIIENAPLALISGLYRPFPSERGNIFKRIIGMGNLILLLLTVSAFRQKWPSEKMNSLLLLCAITYIVIEAVFLSLSTPNFGTLSRYKMGYIPLMVFLVLANNPILDWLEKKLKLLEWRNR